MSPSIWKRNPPCKAHRILESMFKNNEIAPDATPASVQKLHSEFSPFSAAVFRVAFNELRQRHGTERKILIFVLEKSFYSFVLIFSKSI